MATTLLLFVHNNKESVQRVDKLVGTDLNAMLGEKLKLSVDAMSFVLSNAIKNAPTLEAKKQMIEHLLKGFRFEEDHSSYFFVYDLYTAISTGNPKFHVGTNMENFHDKNGVYYVKELYRVAMAGGRFVYYIVPKPLPDESTRPVQKISYAQKIEGVPNLWIATGCIWTMCNNAHTWSPPILNTIWVKNFTSMSWSLQSFC